MMVKIVISSMLLNFGSRAAFSGAWVNQNRPTPAMCWCLFYARRTWKLMKKDEMLLSVLPGALTILSAPILMMISVDDCVFMKQ